MADLSINRINPMYRVEPQKEEPENKKQKKDQEEENKDKKKSEDSFVESKEDEKKPKEFMGHTMDWVSLNQSLKGEFNETA